MLVRQTMARLDAMSIPSCCSDERAVMTARHDIIVNIILNNIRVQRGLVANKQN